MFIDSIPQELKELPNWCVWKYETRRGKQTKVPFNPQSQRRAKSNDPATWTDFTTISSNLGRYYGGQYEGLGFFLSKDTGLTVIDLDDCLQNEELSSWVKTFKTYTEVSPSGQGLHLFLKGVPPGNRKRKNGLKVEIYTEKRFIAITGDTLDSPEFQEIQERQEVLEAFYHWVFGKNGGKTTPARCDIIALKPVFDWGLNENPSDSQVLENLRQARNSEKFNRLLSGDTSDYEGDHSSADFALCCQIAFYTANPQQIERIFNQSKLAERDKWQKRQDYRERTITRAIEVCCQESTEILETSEPSEISEGSETQENQQVPSKEKKSKALLPSQVYDEIEYLGFDLKYNELNQRLYLGSEVLNENQFIQLTLKLHESLGKPSKDLYSDCLKSFAYSRRYHPIKLFLDKLETLDLKGFDPLTVLSSLITGAREVSEDSEIVKTRRKLEIFLASCINRWVNGGQAFVLVLQGN